jgi:hypothetical protein
MRIARGRRERERFAVHPREREHAARRCLLRDSRDEAVFGPAHGIEPGTVVQRRDRCAARHRQALTSIPAAAIAAFACPTVNSP